jgi:hypothetical protein
LFDPAKWNCGVDTLIEVVEREIERYAGEMANGYAYLTVSADRRVFTIVSLGKIKNRRITHLSLLVRIVGERVVMEEDDSNKPLVDVLVQVGIPREQIILAYAGEPGPETV